MWLQTLGSLQDIILFIAAGFGLITLGILIFTQRGNPSKTIAWALVIAFLPLIGSLLYFAFGVNYRQRKLYRQKLNKDQLRYQQLIDEEYYRFEELNWMQKPEVSQKSGLAKLLLKSSKSLFTDNNKVEILQNGQATFAKIFEELKKAKSFIHIQYYIFEEGEIADTLLEILEQKITQGIEVRLIYDAVGSWHLSKAFKAKLTQFGVQHREFLPVRFVQLANKINHRNHRKMIVIDAKVGFTGGINVSDKYFTGDHLGQWRDTFLYLEGNAVNGLQYLFLSDWRFAANQDLLNPKYFLESSLKTGKAVQIVGSGPDSDYAGIQQEYDTLIHSAQSYIYITNPYLIPGEVIQSALISAAMRGIDVRILIPGVSDFKIVKHSSNSYLSSLMRTGVKIYRYQQGFLHSKVIVSDDVVASVGTGNMDIRSFELNFEVNALIYDAETSLELKNQFIKDCQSSQLVDYQKWKQRPFYIKALESLSRLFSPVL